MADEKLVALLRQGVDAWNEWRRQNPVSVFPTGYIKLGGADLSGGRLAGANLDHAFLLGANLRHADLHRADLSHAILRGADLAEANVSGADLLGADLVKANLRRAILVGADFRLACLHGANLSEALFEDSLLADVDLSGAENLDTCYHKGPSVIDFRTLQQSWPMPLSFLRGCGLPDNLIEYLPSLLNQPIQFYSCFLSHSSKDDEFARRLYADLQDTGVRCWFAPEDMKIGDRIRDTLDRIIRVRDKLLVVLSEHSIASRWVEREVEAAIEEEDKHPDRRTTLFPVRIDDAVINSDLAWAREIKRTRHIGDFSHWKEHDAYRKGFERLLRDLKPGLERKPG